MKITNQELGSIYTYRVADYMKEKEIKLKPCPFCGGRAEFVTLDRYLYRHVVQCTKCEAITGGSAYENDEYNAGIWNKRIN